MVLPANPPPMAVGRSFAVYQTQPGPKVAVLSLLGRLFMKPMTDCPFRAADRTIAQIPSEVKIIAVDMQNGRILWSRDVSTYTGMDVDANNVYLTDAAGEVIAYDQHTGASVWKQEHLRARQLNAPRYMNGLVAVGDFEGYVHWLSSDDGHFVARYRVSHSPIRSQALTGQGMFYICTQSGKLAALRLDNKSIVSGYPRLPLRAGRRR